MLLPNPANEIPGERTETSIQSELVDGRGKISIDRMLEARCGLQRGTTSMLYLALIPNLPFGGQRTTLVPEMAM